MGKRIRDFDWGLSALGPTEHWPPALISTLNICLGARFPMAIYWGSEGYLLYNDAWRPILGNKHPDALGKSAYEVWPEIWEEINPLFESVRSTGEATWSEMAVALPRLVRPSKYEVRTRFHGVDKRVKNHTTLEHLSLALQHAHIGVVSNLLGRFVIRRGVVRILQELQP